MRFLDTNVILYAVGTEDHWDAAILEAAKSMDCAVVLSEDLNDGKDYGGVRVQNPFHTD